jgi:hypothetical protein
VGCFAAARPSVFREEIQSTSYPTSEAADAQACVADARQLLHAALAERHQGARRTFAAASSLGFSVVSAMAERW